MAEEKKLPSLEKMMADMGIVGGRDALFKQFEIKPVGDGIDRRADEQSKNDPEGNTDAKEDDRQQNIPFEQKMNCAEDGRIMGQQEMSKREYLWHLVDAIYNDELKEYISQDKFDSRFSAGEKDQLLQLLDANDSFAVLGILRKLGFLHRQITSKHIREFCYGKENIKELGHLYRGLA